MSIRSKVSKAVTEEIAAGCLGCKRFYVGFCWAQCNYTCNQRFQTAEYLGQSNKFDTWYRAHCKDRKKAPCTFVFDPDILNWPKVCYPPGFWRWMAAKAFGSYTAGLYGGGDRVNPEFRSYQRDQDKMRCLLGPGYKYVHRGAASDWRTPYADAMARIMTGTPLGTGKGKDWPTPPARPKIEPALTGGQVKQALRERGMDELTSEEGELMMKMQAAGTW